MRLLYLAYARVPTEKAHGVQIMKTCEALANAGTDITLMLPGRKTPIAEDPFTHYGIQKRFPVISLRTPDLIEFGPLGFMLGAVLFAEAARMRREFHTADIVYSRDAFVLLQYLLLGKQCAYEAHTKPTFVSRIVARQAKTLVVISEGLRDAYLRAGVRKEKIVIAHDAVDTSAFVTLPDKTAARRALDIPLHAKIALYVGRIDAAKGVETLAAAQTHLSDTEVVIVGSGPLKESLIARYPKVRFLPETPYRELPQVLAIAEVLVIPNSATDTDASLYTSPLKAFAFMASGIPIVASDVPALRNILDEKSAYFFKADDPESLAGAIGESLRDPSLAATRAAHAREVGKGYTWEARAHAILSGTA
jgi:glycosyltransferase involved in cell wall biosynthesis